MRTSFATLILSSSVFLAVGCDSSEKPAIASKTDAKKTDAKKTDAKKTDAKKTDAKKTDAKGWQWNLPKGLSTPPAVPADNPMTAEKVELGHKLFMDNRLSGDGSRSCYSCHQNQLGNADGLEKALGAGDKQLSRNSPTIWNVGYHSALYWDGRAPSLEKQALGAWKGGNMGAGADKLSAKAEEIGKLPEYKDTFAKVFGLSAEQKVEPMHVAQAISAYERTLLCGGTVADEGKLDETATRGQQLFAGKAGCLTCHQGENFSDGLFHNVGLEAGADGKTREGADVGHGKVAKDAAKNYTFRTPTLRNVSRTGPYFHNGSVATLADAVRLMASGGAAKAEGKSALLVDRKLSDGEIGDLVAYLKALDCPQQLEVIGTHPVPGKK